MDSIVIVPPMVPLSREVPPAVPTAMIVLVRAPSIPSPRSGSRTGSPAGKADRPRILTAG
jgi:hypothetical protein